LADFFSTSLPAIRNLQQGLGGLAASDFQRQQAQINQGNIAANYGLNKLASERAQKEQEFRINDVLQKEADQRFIQAIQAHAGENGYQVNPGMVSYFLQNGGQLPPGTPAQVQKDYVRAAQDVLGKLEASKSPELKYLSKYRGYYGGMKSGEAGTGNLFDVPNLSMAPKIVEAGRAETALDINNEPMITSEGKPISPGGFSFGGRHGINIPSAPSTIIQRNPFTTTNTLFMLNKAKIQKQIKETNPNIDENDLADLTDKLMSAQYPNQKFEPAPIPPPQGFIFR